MRKIHETEIKVGLFVTLGVMLVMFAILLLGSSDNILARKNTYFIHFQAVEGLVSGAKVVVGGMQIGTVDELRFDAERRDIRVKVSVNREISDWIRKDSTAEILTQGVLGDKYVSITVGQQDVPPMPAGGEIPNRPSRDLTQFLSKGDQLLVSLNSITKSLDHLLKTFETNNRSEKFFEGMAVTAKNLSQVTDKLNRELDQIQIKNAAKNLNSILEKINNGTGTLGAFINDPTLYYDAKALMGQANRNRVVRNLVRQTIKQSEEKK